MSMTFYKCRNISEDLVNKNITVAGWLHNKRDHGSLLFIDLRDCTGFLQVVINSQDLLEKCHKISLESVIQITGTIVLRDKKNINPHISTGAMEMLLEKIIVLSPAKELPFPVNHHSDVPEELRFSYRFLDLRREETKNIVFVFLDIIEDTRKFMWGEGFKEISTPALSSTTPEGAGNFLVISNEPGKFYSLPQSPQIYKQTLMCSGIERYFQIAPCWRNEKNRANRMYQHTQCDLEINFGTKEEVMAVLWNYIQQIIAKYMPNKKVEKEMVIMSYDYIIENYASDKPDLRNPLKIQDVTIMFENFNLFADGIKSGKKVKVISLLEIPESYSFFKDIVYWAKNNFKRDICYAYKQGTEWKGPISKFITDDFESIARNGAFFICDYPHKMMDFLSKLRDKLGSHHIDHNTCSLFFVSDFPMYEYNDETNTWDFMHNPFSRPEATLEEIKTKDLGLIKSAQYDLVLNGNELGSGAERNTSFEVLVESFKRIGKTEEYVRETFPSFAKAFQYGVPPHAGMGIGMERLASICIGKQELGIRNVVPFPMNQNGEDLYMGAPSIINHDQKKDLQKLGINIDIKEV